MLSPIGMEKNVYVRLAVTNRTISQSHDLQVYGIEIAQCTQSDGNGYQNTYQLMEIIMALKSEDVLQF